jgi:hypothetical protein
MLEPDILDELLHVRASGNPTACFPPVTSVAFLRNNFAGKIRPPRVGDTMSRVSHATKRLTSAALLQKKDFDNPGTMYEKACTDPVDCFLGRERHCATAISSSLKAVFG